MNILSIHPMGACVELERAELEALQHICQAASLELLDHNDGHWLTAQVFAGAFQACTLGVDATDQRDVYRRGLDRLDERGDLPPVAVWVHTAPEGV